MIHLNEYVFIDPFRIIQLGIDIQLIKNSLKFPRVIKMNIIAAILISMLSASVAQVLFKYGLGNIGEIQRFDLSTVLNIFFNRYMEIGFILYVISFGLWFYALSKKNLIFVYPFTALTFVFVSLMSVYVLGEPISKQGIFAYILIIIGILLLAQG